MTALRSFRTFWAMHAPVMPWSRALRRRQLRREGQTYGPVIRRLQEELADSQREAYELRCELAREKGGAA